MRNTPFEDMVGNLFGQSDAGQGAGVLSQIIASMGSAALRASAS